MPQESTTEHVTAQIAALLQGAVAEAERNLAARLLAEREAAAEAHAASTEALAELTRGCTPTVVKAAGDSLLLSTHDAAALLRQAPRTLTNWRQLGTGPRYVKHGPRRISYRLADLKAYVTERVTDPARQKLARQSPA
jgi:hypothetical protein